MGEMCRSSLRRFSEVKTGAPRRSVPRWSHHHPVYPDLKAAAAKIFAAVIAPSRLCRAI
jgi:hypothetical protein